MLYFYENFISQYAGDSSAGMEPPEDLLSCVSNPWLQHVR